ncbi:hypothetical protein [Janthinobacterium sp. B9-8]|uniref:hypothetical protein n=1 Tax=Janthinobacterium sp. B9-8 TaxID=1236179 RepID=UPI00061D0887|nr:hypothetical protein [Janthinobacterium sp. B9-8]AMC34240.1 hypothetical protein VN23_06335 [Janthinobacterium sp. B9-8]
MSEQQTIETAYSGGYDALAHIEQQAGALDSEIGGMSGAGGVPDVVHLDDTYANEAKLLLNVAREALGGFYPSLNSIYTDDRIERIAVAAGPLLAKYNITSGGILDKWAAEIGFAVVVYPIAQETIKGVKHDRAVAKAAKEAAEKAAAANEQASA